MKDSRKPGVKSGYWPHLFLIAITAGILCPLFPSAVKILAEQSEFRGQIAMSQVALLKHYVGDE